MTPQKELEKLRAETRELRQRMASSDRSREALRTKKAMLEQDLDQLTKKKQALEEENGRLKKLKEALEEKVKTLEARLAGVTLHKDRLAGMIFKTNNARRPDDEAPRGKRGGQTRHV